jgi:hypothetical protein
MSSKSFVIFIKALLSKASTSLKMSKKPQNLSKCLTGKNLNFSLKALKKPECR